MISVANGESWRTTRIEIGLSENVSAAPHRRWKERTHSKERWLASAVRTGGRYGGIERGNINQSELLFSLWWEDAAARIIMKLDRKKRRLH